MAFHVEISSGFRQRARAFNLDEAKLHDTILDPWMSGRLIQLGDKEWQPRDCKLIILEGPELADTDLSMGRGWSNAEKIAENVTRRLVDAALAPAAPVVVVIAETPSAEEAISGLLKQVELESEPWAEARGLILGEQPGTGGSGYAAVLAFETPTPSGSWLFNAGLARGALGTRAVVAQLGDSGIPVELTGVDVIRLEPREESSALALRDRLVK